jgi:hypothetical protein
MLFLEDSVFLRGFFLFLILCVLSVSLVSAADSVTISSPDVGKPGETISVFVGDLSAGTIIKVQIDGQIKADAGVPIFFQVRDLSLPFSLINPNLHLTADVRNLVPLRNGKLSIVSTKNPPWQTSKNANAQGNWKYDGNGGLTTLPDDTYTIRFNGTADKPQIPIQIIIQGTVKEDVLSLKAVSFNSVGFSNGIFNIYVFTNNNPIPKVQKAFTIQDSLLVK